MVKGAAKTENELRCKEGVLDYVASEGVFNILLVERPVHCSSCRLFHITVHSSAKNKRFKQDVLV